MSWGRERGIATPRDLVNNGQWANYCDFHGIDPSSVITGEIDLDEELESMPAHISSRFGL